MASGLTELILSLAASRWRKVAMIIAEVDQGTSSEVQVEQTAAEIGVLVEAGRLEARGDLTNWRTSEIRLPT